MNTMRVTLLLGLLTGLLIAIGGLMGGQVGVIIAFAFAIVMNVGTYWFSDKIVLSMYRAQEVTPKQAPKLHRMVDELARAAGIPKPKVAVVPGSAPNAFATGRDPAHGVVAVTQGIVAILGEDELRGVLAHEIGHIKNRDTLISCMAATIAGAIMMLASMARWAAIFGGVGRDDDDGGNIFVLIAMAIFAPIAALLIQMAISRTREYQADAAAAQFTKDPMSLAGALAKLDAGVKKLPMKAEPSTSHMFIVNPLSGKKLMGMFSTHPPIPDRIARLKKMVPGVR